MEWSIRTKLHWTLRNNFLYLISIFHINTEKREWKKIDPNLETVECSATYHCYFKLKSRITIKKTTNFHQESFGIISLSC